MTQTDPLSPQVSELPKVPRRRRWVSVALMFVLFLSGVIVGAGSALIVVRNRALMRVQQPSKAVAMDTARLQRVLGLTDEQASKVEAILLARHSAIYGAVQREFDRVEDEVAAVLTEDQEPRWHALLEWFHEKWIPRADSQPR